tara:strand:- start:104 stop:520 length:417 start_codon:yes stop_codon:yes gene_type:complete
METLEKTLATIQKEPNKMNGAKKKNIFSSGTDFFGDKSYRGDSTKKCTPVSFYLVFMGIQIFMDFVNGNIINAIIKFPITIIFVTLLTILCQRNLTVMSWIIVFVPFIFTTLISAFILDNIQTGNASLQTDFINFNMV